MICVVDNSKRREREREGKREGGRERKRGRERERESVREGERERERGRRSPVLYIGAVPLQYELPCSFRIPRAVA